VKNRVTILRAVALLAVAAGLPANAADRDWGLVVFDAVNRLVDQDAALFVPIGIQLVAYAAFSVLIYRGVIINGLRKIGAITSPSHEVLDLEGIVTIVFQMWVLTQILRYWAVPGWGMSHGIHQIPMYISDSLVAGMAASKADQLMAFVAGVAVKMKHPNPLIALDVIVYLFILLDMGILSLVTFLLTSSAYIFEAVFVVITPLFFWCTFFRTITSWCFNCIQNMFSFAAYKVVGGIIITILSDVLVNFFVSGVGPDYSIAHWIVLLPTVIMFTGLFVFSLLVVPLLCASIFNGAGAIGQAVTFAAGKVL
jgi:hypothetical protein